MNRAMFAAALGVLVSVAEAQGPPPARVRFDTVREESVERQRQVTGQLRASRDAKAAAREPGRVVAMLVDVGDRVAEGQPLARLDDALVQLELRRIDADLEAMERSVDEFRALAEKAGLDITRLERAVNDGGVSATELEDARIAAAAARARSARAEADLAAIRASRDRIVQQLADLEIMAPFTGAIVAKLTEVGEWIDVGDAVVEVMQLDPIDAWLEVPESYVDDLDRVPTVVIDVDSVDQHVPGTEVVVVARANELARTFPVRVRLSNPSGTLKPGMSVSAELPTGLQESVVTVHKDALLRDDAGTYVYFDAGGVAMPARVDRLWGAGERVVIRSAMLRSGMRVVTEGNERLFPSQPLIDIDAPAPASAAQSSAEEKSEPTKKGG